MKQYLLTIQLQQKDGAIFLTNEIINMKPELWLSKKIRDYENGDTDAIIVIMNCVELIEPNSTSITKIGASNLEIKLKQSDMVSNHIPGLAR